MKLFSGHRSIRFVSLQLIASLCAILLIQPAAIRTQAGTPAADDGSKITTVFLVRHAEKESAPPQDPALTEAGRARAEELARILKQSGIKAIYTSQFARTKLTAEPLAKELGIEAMVIPLRADPSNPREVSKQSLAEIVEKIHGREGEASLVVGHSNTVPEVIKMLGGDMVPVIDEKQYDDLFIVTVYGRGKAGVIHLKYGIPTEPGK